MLSFAIVRLYHFFLLLHQLIPKWLVSFSLYVDIEYKAGFQSAGQFVSQVCSTDVVQMVLYYSTDSGLAS